MRISITLILLLFLSACQPASIKEASEDKLIFVDPHIRAAFAQAPTGAAYITIHNQTALEQTLTHITANTELADSIELHDMLMEDDMMIMQAITTGIAIPAHASLALQAGGQHIMLMGLNTPLTPGKTFTLTLHFANGEEYHVSFPVIKL
jgi:copper(I)-binding protein